MGIENINILAVLVAAISAFVVGSLWYSPFLFGDIWMKMVGLDKKDKKKQKSMAVQFGFYFVGQLIMAFVLANIFYYFQIEKIADSLITGFWVWFGFVSPITLGSVLWEQKSIKLYILNNSYNLISLFLMGIILVLWP